MEIFNVPWTLSDKSSLHWRWGFTQRGSLGVFCVSRFPLEIRQWLNLVRHNGCFKFFIMICYESKYGRKRGMLSENWEETRKWWNHAFEVCFFAVIHFSDIYTAFLITFNFGKIFTTTEVVHSTWVACFLCLKTKNKLSGWNSCLLDFF